MSRMARSKRSPLQQRQRLLGRVGVARHHAPLGGLQRQDAPVGGVVVDHQQALALQRRLLADEVALARLRCGSVAGRRLDGEVEGRAAARPGAFHPHRAAHQLGQPLADGQAQAGAAVLARGAAVGLAELLEQPAHASARSCRCRCRAPRSAASSRRSRALDAHRQHHLAGFGELDGVAEQVEQDLAQPRDVAVDRRRHRRLRRRRRCPGPSRRARLAIRSSADSTQSRRSKGCASMSMRPASIFEKSRMSLMIVSSASPLSRMVLAKSRCSSFSGVSSSSPLMPMTAFIGVRISWLIVARKALLASLAASAAARASCACLEQPRVLDRDHRLVGEGLEQRDLLVAKRRGGWRIAYRSSRCRWPSQIIGASTCEYGPMPTCSAHRAAWSGAHRRPTCRPRAAARPRRMPRT